MKKYIFLFITVSGWWLSRSWINARNIECYTQYGICSDDISAGLGWLQRTPLLFPLPQAKIDRQFSQMPQVKSVRLYRRLPGTLVVSVDLRKPLGVIGPQVLGAKATADEDGVIIGFQEDTRLPQLLSDTPADKYVIGQRLDNLQSRALQVLSDVGSISGSRVLGRLQDSRLDIVLSDTTQVIIDLKYLRYDWESTLHLILDRSKIQSKVPKTIDLRFSNPVVTF